MERTALITGASAGIGEAIARALAPAFHLILVARRGDRLRELARSLPRATVVEADLATTPGIATAAAAAAEAGLDALVNNAGVFTLADCAAIDAVHLDRQWAINVRAPMLLTAACLPRMRQGATIVNVSSQVAELTFPGCGAYTAGKCALEGWSRVLREELRPRRVRVTVVAPGATDTEIWPPQFAATDRSRMSRAEDVAAAVHLAVTADPRASIDRIAISPPAGSL